jgi:hypothetical protein
MNSSRQDETLMEPHQPEVGTQTVRACRAGLSRRSKAKAEAQSAKAGGRWHGRKKSDARANGFSPRPFGFVGKTSERGRLVCVGVQASACLNDQAKA